MTPRIRSRASALALLVVALVASFGPARADVQSRVIAFRGEYVPGEDLNHVPAVLLQGNSVVFMNNDVFAYGNHTMTADQVDALGVPIFDSGQVNYQQSATLDLSSLPSGVYKFHCNVHAMFGTLCIEGPDGPNACNAASSS